MSYFLNIPFGKVEKKLYEKRFPLAITNTTLVNSDWLPIILGLKSTKRKFYRVKKKKVIKEVFIGLKPKNKVLIRNWLKRKQELKNKQKKSPRPIIISTPMGGKVR